MEHTSDDERARTEPPSEEAAQPTDNHVGPSHGADETPVPSSMSASTSTSIPEETHDSSNGNAIGCPQDPERDNNSSSSARHKDRPISGVVPPYWRHHRASISVASVDTSRSSKPAITLEDHSEDPEASSTRGLWAKNVTIEDYTVVSGKTGIGAYVVWMCRVQTLDGGPMIIRMRYSEFHELRELLARAFPQATNALPPLPPKSVIFKFRPKFLESRRLGLQYFLNCVLLNPEFSGAPVLKDFLFSRIN